MKRTPVLLKRNPIKYEKTTEITNYYDDFTYVDNTKFIDIKEICGSTCFTFGSEVDESKGILYINEFFDAIEASYYIFINYEKFVNYNYLVKILKVLRKLNIPLLLYISYPVKEEIVKLIDYSYFNIVIINFTVIDQYEEVKKLFAHYFRSHGLYTVFKFLVIPSITTISIMLNRIVSSNFLFNKMVFDFLSILEKDVIDTGKNLIFENIILDKDYYVKIDKRFICSPVYKKSFMNYVSLFIDDASLCEEENYLGIDLLPSVKIDEKFTISKYEDCKEFLRGSERLIKDLEKFI